MKQMFLAVLRLLGKGETKIAMAFGVDPESSHAAVLYIRRGAPGVPVHLFSHTEPLPETIPLCHCVDVSSNSSALLYSAVRRLWPCWVAIAVTTWSGRPGQWMLKLAPFWIPPFHALVQNENGDFLPGQPAFILRHCRRRLREGLRSVELRAWDLARGYGLLWASLVLRVISCFCGPFHRWRQQQFQYLKSGESLPAGPPTIAHGRVLCFCQNGSHWSGSTLEQILKRGDAGWVLWREDSRLTEGFNDLLPLFDDERTFAVSRQVHFRGWKPLLFPTAPFRALQQSEASQVLAPLSSVMLVDSRKLGALGVPRCSLAGTAWMILFWKAAAAGWRSYSVGQIGPVCEQPDLPLQETGFRLHLFFNRALRRLGPR
ncbi:MAG: hypothetical protein ABI822_29755, partial [Bryobacteraceae bacterium]